MVEVTRTYLELRDPARLDRRPMPVADARVVHVSPITVEHYRDLYRRVGERWQWRDRLAWSDDRLREQLAKPEVSVWELRVGHASGGYFELERQGEDVEIVYFGLAGDFIGRGFGAAMLTRAVDEGFALGARRVWLRTCTLDSPMALPNYKARGFRETGRVEKYLAQLPD
jgi:GNAT superfamily N-acetyltransferase